MWENPCQVGLHKISELKAAGAGRLGSQGSRRGLTLRAVITPGKVEEGWLLEEGLALVCSYFMPLALMLE